jgi:hypothetical protein
MEPFQRLDAVLDYRRGNTVIQRGKLAVPVDGQAQ